MFCRIRFFQYKIKVLDFLSWFLQKARMQKQPGFWGQRMRDSIIKKVSSPPAGDEPISTGYRHLDEFESLSFLFFANKKRHPIGWRLCWQRMRDSNPRKRSQSPVCYRYTNPLSVNGSIICKILKKSTLFFKFFQNYFSHGNGFPVRTLSFKYRKVTSSPFSASMVRM